GPTDDLVRLAALLRTALPLARPARVRVFWCLRFLVPEERLAKAVALHTHVDGAECRRPEFWRAKCFALLVANTVQEIFPHHVGRVALIRIRVTVNRLGEPVLRLGGAARDL